MEKQLLLKVAPEIKTMFKVEAAKRNITMKQLIIEAVKRYVKQK